MGMTRSTLLKLVAAVIAIGVPTVGFFVASAQNRPANAMRESIQELGFYPVVPPTTLVGPGSVYHVTRDGRFYRTICRADETDVGKVLVRSPSEETIAHELQQGEYKAGGQVADFLNARLGRNIVETVTYRLSDVAMLEIPLDKNEEIFVKLTAEPGCKAWVDRLLDEKEFVCQGQSVLIASVQYNLKTRAGGDIRTEVSAPEMSEMTSKLAEAVIETPKALVNADLRIEGGKIVSGSGLSYGVKVNPVCATRPDDWYPRRIPWSLYGRAKNFVFIDLLGG